MDEWLPPLVLLEDSHGNWETYVEVLHEHFLRDFVHSKPTWPGKSVGLKRHPEYDGKSATFWHLISDGSSEEDRIPNFRRCERIRWPKPIMGTYTGHKPNDSSMVVWWSNERHGETRHVLALRDFSYLMIVADRGSYVLPWTAYHVEHSWRRDKYRREYENYWKSIKS